MKQSTTTPPATPRTRAAFVAPTVKPVGEVAAVTFGGSTGGCTPPLC